MAYDEALAESLRVALKGTAGLSEKKMFGGLGFFLNGNMLCAADKGRYVFRVGKDQEAAALTRPGAAPMAFGERRIGGFVFVDAGECDAAALGEWIAMARAFVDTLPPK